MLSQYENTQVKTTFLFTLLALSSLLIGCLQPEDRVITKNDTVYVTDTVDGRILVGDFAPMKIGNRWNLNWAILEDESAVGPEFEKAMLV